MAETLKYGWVSGGRQGTEMTMEGCTRYFHRLGGAFVCASGSTGLMMPVNSITREIVGWAEVPRAAVPGLVDFWSPATTNDDLAFVITDPTAVYKMPVSEAAASLSASLVGRYVCATWTGSGSTWKQLADANATTVVTSQMFFVTGVDTDSKTGRVAYVRVSWKHGVAT
jgi:hypothetical protein